MSTDMVGWVEDKETEDFWWGAILIDCILIGHYDAYACLFGVRNYANFRPIAPNRGLPFNTCSQVREDESQSDIRYSYGHTWITWSEIQTIDWDERGVDFDERNPNQYAVRRQILESEDWAFFFDVMRLFAERYGAYNVRMVVWFYD